MNDRIEQMSEDACLKKYICEVCDAEFSKVHDIVNHMIDKHTTLKKYEFKTPCGCMFRYDFEAETHDDIQNMVRGWYRTDDGSYYQIDHIHTDSYDSPSWDGWVASSDGIRSVERYTNGLFYIRPHGLYDFRVIYVKGCERIPPQEFISGCKVIDGNLMPALHIASNELYERMFGGVKGMEGFE